MDYKKYSVEDFVLDKEFRKWVLSEDKESDSFWNSWIKKNPGKVSDIQEARTILQNLEFPKHTLVNQEKEELFHQINVEIGSENEPDVPVRYLNVDNYKSSKTRNIGLRIGVAASVLIALTFVISLVINNSHFGQLTYQTDYGKTKEIKLSDGSKVILNANSKLYVGTFSEENSDREVWLEGEAYFDVTHTETDQKFIVHASKIDVNVLGTAFNVYSRAKRAQIELASGKVRLANTVTEAEVDMTPGDKVVYESVYEQPVKQKVDPSEISAWKDNLLIFRRNSLEEITALLKTNYDIDVFFTGGATSDHFFTGTVPADNIDLLLKTIAKSFDLSYEKKDKTVIIKPKNGTK